MEKPLVKKLKNGFIIGFVPHKGVKSVTLQLRGLAGSNYEAKDQIGASHLVEHLSVENKEKEQIMRKGGKIVGVTSRDEVLYMVKVLKKDLPLALKYFSEVFSGSEFGKDRFLIQKNIAKEEVKRFMNVPEKLIGRVSYQLMFPGQRSAGLNTGSVKDLDKLSLASLMRFKKQNYIPNKFCLTISGDVNSTSAIKECEKLFKRFKRGAIKNISLVSDNKFCEQKIYSNFYTQTHIKIDYQGRTISDELRFSTLVLAKCIDIYLKSELRTKKGLVYNAACESFFSGNYGIFSIYCATDHRNALVSIKTLLSIYASLPNIINAGNLELAKNQILADLQFSYEKTSFRADYYSQLLLSGMYGLTFDQELKNIKSITLKDLLSVSKSIFSQEPKITIFTKKPFSKDLGRVFTTGMDM